MDNRFFASDFTVTGITSVWNGLYHPRSNHMVNRAMHGLVLIRKDVRDYIFDSGETVSTPRNHILYLPRSSSYRLNDLDACDCISINYTTLEETSFGPFVFPAGGAYSAFEELYETADRIWAARGAGYTARIKSILYQIIYLMQKNYLPEYIPRQAFERISKAVEYINLNFAKESIAMSALAEMSDMSEVYFRKLFVKLYGVSPLKYINRLKLGYAEELLRSDMYKIHEIARLSGYGSEYYFSRQFKLATGFSPTEFKASRER